MQREIHLNEVRKVSDKIEMQLTIDEGKFRAVVKHHQLLDWNCNDINLWDVWNFLDNKRQSEVNHCSFLSCSGHELRIKFGCLSLSSEPIFITAQLYPNSTAPYPTQNSLQQQVKNCSQDLFALDRKIDQYGHRLSIENSNSINKMGSLDSTQASSYGLLNSSSIKVMEEKQPPNLPLKNTMSEAHSSGIKGSIFTTPK